MGSMAHEDRRDQNPDEEIVKFCSKFPEARNCPYQFTPKWLTEPKNCTKFKKHVIPCLNSLCFKNVKYGQLFIPSLCFEDMASKKFNPTRLAHHSYSPFFFRLPSPNQLGKVELLALFFLLKFDARRNQTLSFAFVRLTPPPEEEEEETTQMVVEIRIDGKPSCNMKSEYGQSSLPSQSWTQKPMTFNRFLDMVETSTDVPLPFTLPVSFLSEYYSSEDQQLNVKCRVQLISEEEENDGDDGGNDD